MQAIIFVGSGKISHGKLAQALDHGALTLQVDGDFDDAMERVRQVTRQLGQDGPIARGLRSCVLPLQTSQRRLDEGETFRRDEIRMR